MKRHFAIIFSLFFLFTVNAEGKNRAFLVGISTYEDMSKDSGWNRIDAESDVRFIQSILGKDFSITAISDKDATFQGITTGLQSFCKTVSTGDTVIVHFSSHGQQMITEISDSEPDGLEEAIVTYDARKYLSSTYHGENHLRDHVLSEYLDRIRKAAGPTGLVIVTLDSCHCGDSQRAEKDDSLIFRGTSDVFGEASSEEIQRRLHIRESANPPEHIPSWADIYYVFACKSYQVNYQINVSGRQIGSLSYCFYSSFSGVSKSDMKSLCENAKSLLKKMKDPRVVQTMYWVSSKQ